MDSIGVATVSLSLVVGGVPRGGRGKGGKGNEESEVQHLFSENIFPPDAIFFSRTASLNTHMLPVEGAEAICEFSLLRRLLFYSLSTVHWHYMMTYSPVQPTFEPGHFAPACNHIASLHFSLNLLKLEAHFQDRERFQN